MKLGNLLEAKEQSIVPINVRRKIVKAALKGNPHVTGVGVRGKHVAVYITHQHADVPDTVEGIKVIKCISTGMEYTKHGDYIVQGNEVQY